MFRWRLLSWTLLTVLKCQIQPSNKHGKGSICTKHLELGFYLTEFHEFWCLSISVGGYQKIWKEGHGIITCAAIFLNLEESRSHGRRPNGPGGRAPAQLQGPMRLRLLDHAPPPLIFKENCAIKVGLIRRPTFIWGGYISKASPPQGERRNHY